MSKVCENCKWYVEVTLVDGTCVRFPKWLKVGCCHYCGEFKERDGE